MKALHNKVNIIPIIAKSDTLTPNELKKLKSKVKNNFNRFCNLIKLFICLSKILEELNENKIQIYKIPECDSDEDEEFKEQNRQLKVLILRS